MREKPRNPERLEHIRQAINNILEFTNGIDYEQFSQDKMRQFAVAKNFEINGKRLLLFGMCLFTNIITLICNSFGMQSRTNLVC